jgi:GT2 family glycosyltransferase
MNFDVTVSIVLYKTPVVHLRQAIESLRLYRGRLHLFLVDNSPTDSLRSECPTDLSCQYIHLPSNPGFGTAHNVAINKSQTLATTYHIVMNADIYFNGDVITTMLAFMDESPHVGQLMPKVLNTDGSIQRTCKLVPTPADLFFRRFTRGEIRGKVNCRFELHSSGYDKIMFVPYLSGCFMLLRQSALKEIGLFDERFFMYPEDIDLTRRMAERHETVFFPHVSVVHDHGKASYKSFKMLFIHIFNIVKYFNKWGWFKDPARVALNKKTLAQFSVD